MNPNDRAELDRLLDLAEKEQLLASAPSLDQERAAAEVVLAEQRAVVASRERELHAVRQRQQQLASDAEWID